MAKNPTIERLVCLLCTTLAELNAMHGAKLKKSAEQSACDIEASIKTHLEPKVIRIPHVARAMVSSGSSHLAQMALKAHSGPVILEARDWRRLLACVTPAELKAMLDDNLSKKGLSIPLFGLIAAGHDEWEPILLGIGEDPQIGDHSILSAKHERLLRHPNLAQTAAAYLTAQVSNHPGQYRMLALNFIGDGRIYHAAVIHAAGLPLEKISPSDYGGSKIARWFKSLGRSNHGRLALAAHCNSLPELLQDQKRFERWAHNAVAAEADRAAQ